MFAEKEKLKVSLLGFVSYPTQTVSSKRIDYVICFDEYFSDMPLSQCLKVVFDVISLTGSAVLTPK